MLPALAFAIYNALTLSSAAASSAPCSVVAQPRLSLAPLRAVRIKVVVEPRGGLEQWRKARLCLVDEVSEIRCSVLWEGDSAFNAPRTTWVNWEVPALPAGEYGVALVVQGVGERCMASDRLLVNGEMPQ